jgi:hypothetical protein
MGDQDIFAEEWRACLQAHLRHVVAEGDSANEQSLAEVLHEAGFADEEVSALRRKILAELGDKVPSEVLEHDSSLTAGGLAMEASQGVLAAEPSTGNEASTTPMGPINGEHDSATRPEMPETESESPDGLSEPGEDEPPPLVQMSLF